MSFWVNTARALTLAMGALVVRNVPERHHEDRLVPFASCSKEVLRSQRDPAGVKVTVTVHPAWQADLRETEPIAIAADGAGRVYLLDGRAGEVIVYSEVGRRLGPLGRGGSVDVHFQQPIGMWWDCMHHLWVADDRNERFTVFDTSGNVLGYHSLPTLSGPRPMRAGFDPAGHFRAIVGSVDSSTHLSVVTFNDSLRRIDSLPLPSHRQEAFILHTRGHQTVAYVPFAPQLVVMLDWNGDVWYGESNSNFITRVGRGRRSTAVLRLGGSPKDVTPSQLQKAIQGLSWFTSQGGVVDTARIPRRLPTFISLSPDSRGRMWVGKPISSLPETQSFAVFASGGELIGQAQITQPILLQVAPSITEKTFAAIASDESGRLTLFVASLVGFGGSGH